MKIVLDTNCLLVVLPQNSPYRCLWDAFRQKRFSLCYTTDILQEYEELLLRYYSADFTGFTLEMLIKSPNIYQVIPFYKWNLITGDPDDNKFVDCALNADSDYIVTNDKHFNVLKEINFPFVKVIDIKTFKTLLKL
jgi:putative PIN family toxin of toxin-antitoxin system